MKVEIPNQITVTIGGLISRGIKAAEVTDEGKLIFTLTDGSELDLGSVIGPQGPKGETGAQGKKGDTGAQGPKGDTGAAGASITKIEKKSQSGQTATYTITLSDGKTFDFDVDTVKGETGAQGPKGDTGDTGPQGPKGDTGDAGGAGPQGPKGDTGPQGPKGDKGDAGAGFRIMGYYGSASALQAAVASPNAGDAYGVGAAEPYDIYIFDGVTGAWINNGPLQGAKGSDGATPTIGGNGNWFLGTVDTGKPSRGETGPQGDKGGKGDKGEPGTPGADGKDGANGVTPTIGTNGNWYLGETDTGKPSRGETGPKGDKGDKGDTGDTGPQGPQGETGPKGDTGAQGPAGATPVKGTDYFTAADKAELVQDVLAALPEWTGGSY